MASTTQPAPLLLLRAAAGVLAGTCGTRRVGLERDLGVVTHQEVVPASDEIGPLLQRAERTVGHLQMQTAAALPHLRQQVGPEADIVGLASGCGVQSHSQAAAQRQRHQGAATE